MTEKNNNNKNHEFGGDPQENDDVEEDNFEELDKQIDDVEESDDNNDSDEDDTISIKTPSGRTLHITASDDDDFFDEIDGEMRFDGDDDDVYSDEDIENDDEENIPKISSYFADDEEELPLDDLVLHEDDSLAVIQQMENVVMCEIVNLYKDNGKPRSRHLLKTDPPIFFIENNLGEGANFVVTQELARNLERMFGDIRKGYIGVDPTVRNSVFTKKGAEERKNAIIDWVDNNRGKFVAIVAIILLVIGSSFL